MAIIIFSALLSGLLNFFHVERYHFYPMQSAQLVSVLRLEFIYKFRVASVLISQVTPIKRWEARFVRYRDLYKYELFNLSNSKIYLLARESYSTQVAKNRSHQPGKITRVNESLIESRAMTPRDYRWLKAWHRAYMVAKYYVHGSPQSAVIH